MRGEYTMLSDRDRTLSIVANLNDTEYFILHDPAMLSLYQRYLASSYPHSNKANHIPFFSDISKLGERCSESVELQTIIRKYIAVDATLPLDIPAEKLQQVHRRIYKAVTLPAFKPAIKEVVRDLAFVYMGGFIKSAVFKSARETLTLVDSDVDLIPTTTVQQKDSTHKLRKFFGDKSLQAGTVQHAQGGQPRHIKEYRLSKKFGERVAVEKTSSNESEEVAEDSPTRMRRRNRRLHVFFGDNFAVEDTLFSERVRPQSGEHECALEANNKQPYHVNAHRLTRFFGARPPSPNDWDNSDLSDSSSSNSSSDGSGSENSDSQGPAQKRLSKHSKTQHLNRFFGERMDPNKEATSVTFAAQPENVKPCTLFKIFGENASHSLNFDVNAPVGTWPTARNQKSRSKLEKIFGPFEN